MTISCRGSEWRKWDLHLHSPFRLISGSGKIPPAHTEEEIQSVITEYVAAIKTAGISAIGLTNYFKFDERDYRLKRSLEAAGVCVFLNLELRLTLANKENQLLDYHIIFDNKVTEAEIQLLLSNLKAKVGNTIVPAINIDESNKDIAAFDFDSILETLFEEHLNLRGRFLTAFLSRGHGHSVGEGKFQVVYQDIARKSDLLLHSSDFPWTLESDKSYWASHLLYPKALLQSSDAHSVANIGISKREVDEKYKDRIGVYQVDSKYFVDIPKFTWIKSDLSFDGLRQILFEPEGRVAHGIQSPDKKADYLVIDNIAYGDKKLFLNSGLNTIIGGRSTGKSTLLKSIAKNQGVNANIDHTLMDEGNEFSVCWRDGVQDSTREVEYISQNYMQEVADDSDKLNKIINKVLGNKGLLSKEGRYQRDLAELKFKLSQGVDNYYESVSKYKTLQKPEGDLTGVNNQINNLESQIQGILMNNNFTEQEKVAFENIEKEIAEITENLKVFENDIQRLENLKYQPPLELNTQFQYLMNQLSGFNKDLIDNGISLLISEAKSRISQMLETRIDATRQEIALLKQKQQSYTSQEIYKKGLTIRNSSNLLSQLYEAKQIEINKRSQIESYNKERQQLWKEINQEMGKLATDFGNYKNLIDNLAKDYELPAGDLIIKLNTRRVKFEDKIDFLNGRDRNNRDFISSFDETEFDDGKMHTLLISMFPLHKESLDFKFNGNRNIGDLIKEIFVNDWFDYDYEIIYQGDNFKQMSQGKKAFVVLQLLLDYSDDKKPILIDQPEDSLDNRAIYHELRKYLVQKKDERQIIVVTHNPNIVVGADAENVIVANQHSPQTPNDREIKFDYINGALENSSLRNSSIKDILGQQGIREHVFEILEGGKEAFEKREQKYKMK